MILDVVWGTSSYLEVMPFDESEFLARVKAVIRRSTPGEWLGGLDSAEDNLPQPLLPESQTAALPVEWQPAFLLPQSLHPHSAWKSLQNCPSHHDTPPAGSQSRSRHLPR